MTAALVVRAVWAALVGLVVMRVSCRLWVMVARVVGVAWVLMVARVVGVVCGSVMAVLVGRAARGWQCGGRWGWRQGRQYWSVVSCW